MSKKLIAGFMAVLMALVTAISPVLAAPTLDQYPGFLGTPGTDVFVVVGDAVDSRDVVGAVNLAIRLAEVSVREVEIPTTAGISTVTGGVSLDTADTKIYLTDVTNKAKQILTSNEVSDLLASGSVEDSAGTKYEYKQYLNIGNKQIQFAQPDVSSGIKDPAYLVKLGTSPSGANYLIQAWVSFTKTLNASTAVGKELKLFGKSFTISSETDSSKLVLFGFAGKETIGAGESKTITVAGNTYTVTVVGIIDATSAVLNVNGVQKEVTEGNTYDFAGTSVYVSDVFYYKVPTETGSVVVSIGADRYVFQQGSAVKKGTSGNEVDIKGTYVAQCSPQALSDLKISFDAYSATPAVDYIKEGTVWTDPIFGIKVSYAGPAPTATEDILIQPGATNYYTITFTDKYGKSGTVSWVYDANVASAGGETLADSVGNAIHVVENENAAINEYVFVSAGNFPHMLKVSSLDTSAVPKTVTFTDVFSGTEYKATNNTGTNTGSLVIDGQSYTVTFGSSSVSIADSETGTVVFPTLQTNYGAKIALVKSATPTVGTLVLPTGTVTVASNGTHFNVSGDATVAYTLNTDAVNVTVGRVWYQLGPVTSTVTVRLSNTTYPAVLLVEEKTKDPNVNDAVIFYTVNDASTDKRLELQAPVYTHDSGNIFSGVGTASTYVTNAVTEWGTKVVYDSTAAGTATITYPDTQVYNLVAVGSNPVWSVGGVAGGKYKEILPVRTPIATLASKADKTKNLILVGGPCANTLVQELVDTGKLNADYTCAGRVLGSAWTPNTAYIIVTDGFTTGKYAVVVAGTAADDTVLASNALQQYDASPVKEAIANKSAVKIVGTAIATATITAA